jgi:hypothetical protein
MCVLFNAEIVNHVTVFLPPSPLPGGPNPALFLSLYRAEKPGKSITNTYTSATSPLSDFVCTQPTNKLPQTSKATTS